jgi:MFS family permease
MSCVSTVTLLAHSEITIALILNLVVYGLVVNSRESLTVSLLGDSVPEEHYDAAFSLYYFIGFISGPAWTALTGYLVASRGFAVAWWVVGLTYLTGIVLIGLLSSGKKARVTTA